LTPPTAMICNNCFK